MNETNIQCVDVYEFQVNVKGVSANGNEKKNVYLWPSQTMTKTWEEEKIVA